MVKNVNITGTIECKTTTAKITIDFTRLSGLSKLKHPYSDTSRFARYITNMNLEKDIDIL